MEVIRTQKVLGPHTCHNMRFDPSVCIHLRIIYCLFACTLVLVFSHCWKELVFLILYTCAMPNWPEMALEAKGKKRSNHITVQTFYNYNMITHPFSSPLQILAANASAAHLAVKPTNIETQKLIFPVELMNAVRAETAARLRQPCSEQKWHTITLRLNIKIIKFPKIVPTFLPQKCH